MTFTRRRWYRSSIVVRRYRRRGLFRTVMSWCWALLWWSLLLCWWLVVAVVWCYSMALHWLVVTGIPAALVWWSTHSAARTASRKSAADWSEPEPVPASDASLTEPESAQGAVAGAREPETYLYF